MVIQTPQRGDYQSDTVKAKAQAKGIKIYTPNTHKKKKDKDVIYSKKPSTHILPRIIPPIPKHPLLLRIQTLPMPLQNLIDILIPRFPPLFQ